MKNIKLQREINNLTQDFDYIMTSIVQEIEEKEDIIFDLREKIESLDDRIDSLNEEIEELKNERT